MNLICECCQRDFNPADNNDLRNYAHRWEMDVDISDMYCPECHIHLDGLNMTLDEP